MSLQDDLDALRAEFVRSAPPGRAELYDAKVEELRRTFPIEETLRTSNYAPDFTLPNPSGRPVSLAGLLRGGPAVVTFYRERLEPDAIMTPSGRCAPTRPRPPEYDLLTERNRQ